MTVQIAIYGKGGVGKTTLAANLAAAMAETGKKVFLVGCDLKIDSGTLLHGKSLVPTLLEYLRADETPEVADIMVSGFQGVSCIEVGDSLDDDECATRSIRKALELFYRLEFVEQVKPDYVIFDIPGEMSCARRSSLLFDSPPEWSLVLASGDLMSFYAANSFVRSMAKHPDTQGVALVGNALAGSFEKSFVSDFALKAGVPVAALIPRSLVVRHCELYGKTVIEADPHSTQAQVYRRLALKIIEERFEEERAVLTPFSTAELKAWAQEWGNRLGELEFGIIQDGAGI